MKKFWIADPNLCFFRVLYPLPLQNLTVYLHLLETLASFVLGKNFLLHIYLCLWSLHIQLTSRFYFLFVIDIHWGSLLGFFHLQSALVPAHRTLMELRQNCLLDQSRTSRSCFLQDNTSNVWMWLLSSWSSLFLANLSSSFHLLNFDLWSFDTSTGPSPSWMHSSTQTLFDNNVLPTSNFMLDKMT